jgi:integrase
LSSCTGPTRLWLTVDGGGPKYERPTAAPTEAGAGNRLQPGRGPRAPPPGQGVTQLGSVTVDHLAAWKSTWKEPTDLGKRKEQERLRTFFRWCGRRKYILEDPAEGLARIRADTGGKRERFTGGEIEPIFAVILGIYPNETKAAKVRAFLLTLQYTALRIGDATNLQTSHLIGYRLFLQTMKTGQAVFTVVPPLLVDALNAVNNGRWMEDSPADL